MKEDSAGGISLIASALGTVATMALHPTAREIVHGGGDHHAGSSHSFALISIPLALFGFLVLTRRLARIPSLPLFAFVVYAFSSVAVTSAAVVSGFVAPAMAMGLRSTQGAERDVLDALLHYSGHLNQAFAGVFVVASSVAIILWSWSILRPARWLAAIGIFIGAITLVAYLSGHLRLNVHGFGVIAIAQAIWTICAGVLLMRGAFGTPESVG
jgi:hypothetical protein